MKETSDEIIVEKVRIDTCLPGDNIHVPHSVNKSWKDIGHIVLVSIKTIPKNKVQLKYTARHFSDKIQKVDLDCSFIVERSRKILPVSKSENKIVTIEDAANAFLQEAGAHYLCRGGAHVKINQRTTEYMNNLLKSPRRLSKTNRKDDSYNAAISIEKVESLIECFALGRELTSFLENKTYLPRHLDVLFNK